MPPHCDSLDAPVVTACRQALEARNDGLVLPLVPDDGEDEVRTMFDAVLPVRDLGPARDIADRLFFETVVRVHRTGEGAPYTGLKPAGLSVGPVIPLAEQAVETGSSNHLADVLSRQLRDELKHRLERVNALSASKDQSVPDGRRYVEAMLGFEVYSHHVFQALHAPAHGEHEDAGHHHE